MPLHPLSNSTTPTCDISSLSLGLKTWVLIFTLALEVMALALGVMSLPLALALMVMALALALTLLALTLHSISANKSAVQRIICAITQRTASQHNM